MRVISFFCNSVSGDSSCNLFETQWYKGIKGKMTSGKYLRIYRENKGLTQNQQGEALGGIPRQHISNRENGHRAISLKMARKLSNFLGAPIERFLEETSSSCLEVVEKNVSRKILGMPGQFGMNIREESGRRVESGTYN